MYLKHSVYLLPPLELPLELLLVPMLEELPELTGGELLTLEEEEEEEDVVVGGVYVLLLELCTGVLVRVVVVDELLVALR